MSVRETVANIVDEYEQRQANLKNQIKFDRQDIDEIANMLINGHAGYPDFPEDIRKRFEAGMKNLANSKEPVSVDALWDIIQILPDNHLKLFAKMLIYGKIIYALKSAGL